MKSWAERSINNRTLQFFLSGLVALNLLPFFGELPSWIMIVAAIFLAWNFLTIFQKAPRCPRFLRIFLGFASMGGVFFQFRTLAGEEAATSLLILLSGLKLMESARYRDAMLITFICYFLLADGVLFSQSLGMTAFLIFDLALITSLLFYLHGRDKLFSFSSLRFILRTLAVSLPLWIFLFFMFPRFSAQLWQVASPNDAVTGFSDNLNPGDVEGLVQSDQVAFRASFLQPGTSHSALGPGNEDLYWRGAVLWEAKGLNWSRPPFRPYKSLRYKKEPNNLEFETEIVLEPLFKKFLFPLDLPISINLSGLQNKAALPREGFIFEREGEASARILFHSRSFLNQPETDLDEIWRRNYLKIDPPSPRVSAVLKTLGASVSGHELSAREKEKNVLAYFKNQHFHYTLTPGPMPGGLEQFLFERKVGFCEHYAAAFADLMRWLKVPSRVIVGFQGGNYNSLGGYYIVRTLDAHAWAEIWLGDEKRWLRVDPTAAIVPLRLVLGGDFNTADQTLLQSGLTREQYRTRLESSFVQRWLFRSQAAIDLVSSRWNNFLLSYDFDYQTRLLNQFGIEKASRFILVAWLLLGTIIFVVALQIFLRRKRAPADNLLKAYQKFCEALAGKQLPKLGPEGPKDFCSRVVQRWPSQKLSIENLFETFLKLRYGPIPESASQLKEKRQTQVKNWVRASRRILKQLR